MMPNNNNLQQSLSANRSVSSPTETIEPSTIATSSQRLEKIAKQLHKPVLVNMQPLSSFETWQQAIASSSSPSSASCTVVVLGVPNQANTSHKEKFQGNQLIEALQAQVNQVACGLQQITCTQQFEEETLSLFNKMHEAFQDNNTALFQRHWNSWLQVIELLAQQTATLYGNFQPIDSAIYFAPYCLPNWLFEKTVPETEESVTCYEQFWLSQQQETANRYENAQRHSNQIQIKLENWLAAKTAPKTS